MSLRLFRSYLGPCRKFRMTFLLYPIFAEALLVTFNRLTTFKDREPFLPFLSGDHESVKT